MYRRGLLQTLGVGAVAFGSGCVGPLGSRPRYLEALYVRNDDDIYHEFELTIEQNEETVRETTIELEQSQGPTRVDCNWSGRGPYVAACALSADQTETVRVAEIQEGAGEYADITFIATTFGELGWSGVLDDGGVRRCSGSPSG